MRRLRKRPRAGLQSRPHVLRCSGRCSRLFRDGAHICRQRKGAHRWSTRPDCRLAPLGPRHCSCSYVSRPLAQVLRRRSKRSRRVLPVFGRFERQAAPRLRKRVPNHECTRSGVVVIAGEAAKLAAPRARREREHDERLPSRIGCHLEQPRHFVGGESVGVGALDARARGASHGLRPIRSIRSAAVLTRQPFVGEPDSSPAFPHIAAVCRPTKQRGKSA